MFCFSLALGSLLALAIEPESATPNALIVVFADRAISLEFRACPEWVADSAKKVPPQLNAKESKGTKETLVDPIPSDWWIRSEDVTALVGMEVKAEGLCSESVCVPIPDRAALIHEEGPGKSWVSLSVLAQLLRLPILVDKERSLIAVGDPGGAGGHPLAASEMAPDFTLFDLRSDKPIRLSDYRGKKVFLFTWASWCACNRDLVGWQRVYEEIPEGSIEFLAAAQDCSGESAAAWYDRAGATFQTLIDPMHCVTELYGMVNVPTGVWIDEEGRMVRPPEVAYSKTFRVLGRSVGDDRYAEGLKDWVQRGPESPYWMPPDKVRARLKAIADSRQPGEAALANRLACYLYLLNRDEQGSQQWWSVAQRLDPDNWNYHRQAWSFDPRQAAVRWLQKVRALEERPYYDPVEFPTP